MIKNFYFTILLFIGAGTLSANYSGICKKYCNPEQILVYDDKILVEENHEISQINALFTDNEGLYYIDANNLENCRRSPGLPKNPYRHVCSKPNCPHGK